MTLVNKMLFKATLSRLIWKPVWFIFKGWLWLTNFDNRELYNNLERKIYFFLLVRGEDY